MKTMQNIPRGFSLVTAIFLLVVLGTLGTLMVTFFAAQQQSSALDVMGSRAYQASRVGIEWAAYQVASSPAAAAVSAPCATNFAQNSLGGTLAPFSVTVTCAAASYVEGTASIWVYNVNAVAQTTGNPGGADYVERSISVKMGR